MSSPAYQRRRHRKSRKGCVECKARHRKCDEARPACSQCLESRPARVCNYSIVTQSSLRTRKDTIPREISLNLEHIGLVHHWLSSPDLLSLSDQDYNVTDRLFALETGIQYPFLLNAILAISARHSRSKEALVLQTQAFSLFRVSSVDRDNCVAVLLFCVVVGHHSLADALADRSNLEDWLDNFVNCLGTYRGLRELTMECLPLLEGTPLWGSVSSSVEFTSGNPRGKHCLPLLGMIEGEDLKTAGRYLQLGFDALEDKKYSMLYLWAMLVAPEFMVMLSERKSVALVVLGYYAVLLQHGRHHWQVGDVGEHLFGLVTGYLGEEFKEVMNHAGGLIPASDEQAQLSQQLNNP